MQPTGNTLQSQLDTPIWFKADLDASKKVTYFTTAGLSNKTSINQQFTIDKTAQFTCDQIQIAVMSKQTVAAAAWDATSVELLAEMIRLTWFNFQKNGREYVWSAPAAMLLPTPVTFDATVAAFDISKSVKAEYALQVPVVIPGGQALTITQEWEDAFDFTGLTVQFALLGILDRELAKG